jgi:MerR family transcriptional regulator/heat shock protein HspR
MVDSPRSLLTISAIAKMLNIHPHTLRLYEREGFITPSRSKGNTRQYSLQDVERLRLVLHFTRELGVNLAGVHIILQMRQKLAELQRDIDGLRRMLAKRSQSQPMAQTQQRALIKASSRMLTKVEP